MSATRNCLLRSTNQTILLFLVLLVVLVQSQKSFSVTNIDIKQFISGDICSTTSSETYAFIFTGGNFTQIAIPIMWAALYNPSPSVNILSVSASSATKARLNIISKQIVDSETVRDRGTIAKLIIVNFEPIQGQATFTINYAIGGYLSLDSNTAVMRWATVWPTNIPRVTVHQRFAPIYGKKISTSPSSAATVQSTTINSNDPTFLHPSASNVTYTFTNYPASTPLVIQTSIDIKSIPFTVSCAIDNNLPAWAIAIIVISTLLFSVFCLVSLITTAAFVIRHYMKLNKTRKEYHSDTPVLHPEDESHDHFNSTADPLVRSALKLKHDESDDDESIDSAKQTIKDQDFTNS